MNRVFFLGAGFSAAFGHPVMDSFLGFADSCKRLTGEDRSFLGRLVLEARRANSFLESSPTNLEDILSFSEMGDRLHLTDGEENRSGQLRDILLKTYTASPPPSEYWGRYGALKRLVGSGPREWDGAVSFVTTNYDLNIESACASLQVQVDPGLRFRRVDDGGVQTVRTCYSAGGIPLYKLHGSVNWFADNGDPSMMVVDDRIVLVSSFAAGSQNTLPRPCVADYHPPASPVIVPPSFLKPELSEALRSVWAGAAHALSEANEVVFVGYSFPESDTEMMFFLARALAENAALRAVYVVDPRAPAIAERLRGQGSRMGSHFRDLLSPIASDWTKAALPWHKVAPAVR